MNQHLNIGREPDLQKIVIASAVLHILFVIIIAIPVRSDERELKSYFVSLVSSAEILKASDPEPSGKQVSRTSELLKFKSDAKAGRDIIANGIKNTKNIRAAAEISSSNELLRQAVNNNIPSFEIKRDLHEQERKYNDIPSPAERAYKETAVPAIKDPQRHRYMITRVSDTVQKDTVSEGMKPLFNGSPSPAGLDRDVDLSTSGRKEASTSIEKPWLSGEPDNGAGVSPGQHGQNTTNAASGGDGVSSEKLWASGNSMAGSFSGRSGGSSSIERPGLQGAPGEGGTGHDGRSQQAARNGVPGGSRIIPDKIISEAPDISIKGVPLNDLVVCTNALDEGILKKKILKVIGTRRECYSPSAGRFVFLGTDRYTSFEMLIAPASGRRLSNRCGELKNALVCLNQ
ncbi:MAG: hypothetical protein HY758_06375 [Nitrospirae bacterium]|nr:hypothetical protein [Nitrospirota bacterium]